MAKIRRHLTYANVVATLTAFVVLAGGTAIAANQLAKNSVGKKQLKANAVTTAKIKKNAVTRAKIRNGAIDATRVLNGSLTVAELNGADLPFGRVAHAASGVGSVTMTAFPSISVVTLDRASYTQEAGRDDLVNGGLDLSFEPTCEAPRIAIAYVFLDKPNPLEAFDEADVVAAGQFQDEKTGGSGNVRLNIGATGLAGPLQPAAATNHTLSMIVAGGCKNGAPVTASNVSLQVTGVK